MIPVGRLGRSGPGVGGLGDGSTVLEGYYGASDDETGIATMREHGIALVARAPLGSGFLSGPVPELPEGDVRRLDPRSAGGSLARNTERFAPLAVVVTELGATPARLALARLPHQGEDVFPIPGTRRAERIGEDAKAASLRLDAKTLRRIDAIARPGLAEGATLL